MRWVWHITRKGQRAEHRVLFGRPEEKNHLENLGVDGSIRNIKMDFQEVRWRGMDWIVLSQDRDR
jgi:hypothetical protein